jgi:predicted GH43/DUF377 family glycosyl hydrolase
MRGSELGAQVQGSELFVRHPNNPILTAEDWPYPVNAVFNPAAAAVGEETVLLARVEDRRGISHLTVARSKNGLDGWTVDDEPLLAPADDAPSEEWGFEDPRVSWIEELDRFVITCTSYGPAGPAVYLATTADFKVVERYGVVRQPEDKNAALLPYRIDGRWVLFHRPKTEFGGARGEIFVSRSADLVSWSTPEPVLQPRTGAWWDSLRIGLGPPPLRTDHGWLIIYHGVKETVSGEIYRVGLALLDLDEPTRVLRRLPAWILSPTAPYERTGDVPNVVFPCGLVYEPRSDELRLYYGAADSSICVASALLGELVEALLAEPESG